MEALLTPDFWVAVGQIILIDILLGGDNAVVIALACRRLPAKQRTKGILWGTAGAIVLRIVLIFFALQLLAIPFLKIVGGLLLLWIGVKLLVPEHEGGHANIAGSDKLWGAVKTVIVADFVMSVDNVIAIAGVAESSEGDHGMALVVFGVLISIPIIVWGSQLVIRLMDRFPVIITLGGMLLGWIAGTMLVTDPVLVSPDVMPAWPKIGSGRALHYGAGAVGALFVLLVGRLLMAKRPQPLETNRARIAAGHLRRILLAVDGSPASQRATERIIGIRDELADPAAFELYLLHVQRPVSGGVSSFVAQRSLDEYYKELGDAALAPSRALLDVAGVKYHARQRVGAPGGKVIASEAESNACDLIVMGTRGAGAAAALLGSVAQSTLEHAGVPVLLVK